MRGTLAMAKQPGDPNSVTRQWFINLGNNSSNLDQQNGGFTVFGQVRDLAPVDAIAAVPTFNFGSACTDVPLRDFTPGTTFPDNVGDSSFVIVRDVAVTRRRDHLSHGGQFGPCRGNARDHWYTPYARAPGGYHWYGPGHRPLHRPQRQFCRVRLYRNGELSLVRHGKWARGGLCMVAERTRVRFHMRELLRSRVGHNAGEARWVVPLRSALTLARAATTLCGRMAQLPRLRRFTCTCRPLKPHPLCP